MYVLLFVQVCLDAHAAAMYIVSYMLKTQKDLSQAMHKAVEDAKRNDLGLLQQTRKVGNAFVNGQEMSAQEAAYLALSLPLRNSSRASVFVTTNEAGERTRILKPFSALCGLEDSSTDIFSRSLLDVYNARPSHMEHVCLADFATWYADRPKAKVADDIAVASPKDGLLTFLHDALPKLAKGYGLRAHQRILRYRRFNRLQDPEGYHR
jgi:hypothetical protein